MYIIKQSLHYHCLKLLYYYNIYYILLGYYYTILLYKKTISFIIIVATLLRCYSNYCFRRALGSVLANRSAFRYQPITTRLINFSQNKTAWMELNTDYLSDNESFRTSRSMTPVDISKVKPLHLDTTEHAPRRLDPIQPSASQDGTTTSAPQRVSKITKNRNSPSSQTNSDNILIDAESVMPPDSEATGGVSIYFSSTNLASKSKRNSFQPLKRPAPATSLSETFYSGLTVLVSPVEEEGERPDLVNRSTPSINHSYLSHLSHRSGRKKNASRTSQKRGILSNTRSIVSSLNSDYTGFQTVKESLNEIPDTDYTKFKTINVDSDYTTFKNVNDLLNCSDYTQFQSINSKIGVNSDATGFQTVREATSSALSGFKTANIPNSTVDGTFYTAKPPGSARPPGSIRPPGSAYFTARLPWRSIAASKLGTKRADTDRDETSFYDYSLPPTHFSHFSQDPTAPAPIAPSQASQDPTSLLSTNPFKINKSSVPTDYSDTKSNRRQALARDDTGGSSEIPNPGDGYSSDSDTSTHLRRLLRELNIPSDTSTSFKSLPVSLFSLNLSFLPSIHYPLFIHYTKFTVPLKV